MRMGLRKKMGLAGRLSGRSRLCLMAGLMMTARPQSLSSNCLCVCVSCAHRWHMRGTRCLGRKLRGREFKSRGTGACVSGVEHKT